ncbi:hypothetical protein [Paenibacillus gansuensis]|uniref:DUF4179 domain-containing protein n=1 Tax=Paenibacillus gansuensis TaxID=306542 RepID=A0ABW5PCX6_9BACL
MRIAARIFFITLISLGVAWTLSFVPGLALTKSLKERVMTTFRMEKPVMLGDENLVDFVAQLPLRTSLDKVDWGHSVLYIDLKISEPAGETQSVIFGDLYEIAEFGLLGTENVKEVMLRVYNPESADGRRQKELLLSMEAKRSEITAEDILSLKLQDQTPDATVRSKFHMNLTDLWFDIIPK